MLLAHGAAMVVHNAIYTSTLRVDLGALGKSRKTLLQWDGFAWIDLYEPTEEELRFVTREFDLQPLADDYYAGGTGTVEFDEIYTFLGPAFLVTIQHGEASELHHVSQVAERGPEWLPREPSEALYAIVDRVVEGYSLVVAALQNALEEVRTEVFSNFNVLYRIHRVYRGGIRLRMEARTLTKILERLTKEKSLAIGPELRWYPCKIRNQLLQVANNIEGFCELLRTILRMNRALTIIEAGGPMQAYLRQYKRKNSSP